MLDANHAESVSLRKGLRHDRRKALTCGKGNEVSGRAARA